MYETVFQHPIDAIIFMYEVAFVFENHNVNNSFYMMSAPEIVIIGQNKIPESLRLNPIRIGVVINATLIYIDTLFGSYI